MAEEKLGRHVEIDRDTLAIVAAASEAQAAKVRSILERIDQIAELDPSRVKSIGSLLEAAKSDGGCGIGCW